MSPLVTLLDALRRNERPDFAWVIEHAADGTLDAVWNAESSPTMLLMVYACTLDRCGLVCALLALTRALVSQTNTALSLGMEILINQLETWAYAPFAPFVFRENLEYTGRPQQALYWITELAMYYEEGRHSRIINVHNVMNSLNSISLQTVRALLPCPTLTQLTESR